MKALLVIDIQNDYFWEKRKKKFNYPKELISNINETIDKYKKDSDIIYIYHFIHNIITNRLLFGFSIEGTEGAELYKELNVVSNLKFKKYLGDAFTSREFKEYMNSKKYDEVFICGIDQCGCVYHTALGAIRNNFKVSIITNATGCRYNLNKLNNKKNKLVKAGVRFI